MGCCSVTQSCPTLCDPMDCSTPASLSFIISQSLLKLMSIESVMQSDHLIFCLLLLLLPSVFPSIRVFSNESTLHKWPKYWSFSFSISHSNKYSGLISFRIDWFHLLAVQGTLKASKQAITQSCPTLCDSMVCSLPGPSVHGIFQARVLEWGTISLK